MRVFLTSLLLVTQQACYTQADPHSTVEFNINFESLNRPYLAKQMKTLLAAYSFTRNDEPEQHLNEIISAAEKYGVEFIHEELMLQLNMRSGGLSLDHSNEEPSGVPFSFFKFEHEIKKERNVKALIEHVRHCILTTRHGISKLLSYPHVYELEGMSDVNIRNFMNNLGTAVGTRYLEVGSYKGSSLASMLSGNGMSVEHAIAIDMWGDMFWGDEGNGQASFEVFHQVISNVDYPKDQLRVIRGDFRAISMIDITYPPHPLGPYNIYLFDGPHDEIDHYDGIKHMLPYLADVFVLLIDDFNLPGVKEGTFRALQDLNLNVYFSEHLGDNGNYASPRQWHVGFFVAVVSKTLIN